MKNRIINMILVCAMLFLGIITVKGSEAPPDLETALLLGSLGILGDGTVESIIDETKITRSELAAVAFKLLNINSVPITIEQRFNDVSPNHEAYKEINYIYDMGFFSDTDNRLFRPDEQAEPMWCTKVFLDILGYSELAQIKGGFPNGYLIVSTQVGLKTYSENSAVTKTQLAYTLMDVLKAPYYKQVSYGGSNDYEMSADVTLLTEVFNIYQKNGIVTATDKAELNGFKRVPKGYLTIEADVYDCGEIDSREYLGLNVTAYVLPNELSDKIIFMVEGFKQTKELQSNDILKEQTTATSISYYDGNSQKNVRVSTKANVLYNGVLYNGYSGDTFASNTGNLILIDNNFDGVYDVVKVNRPVDVVVHNYDSEARQISTKNTGSFFLNDDTVFFNDGKTGMTVDSVSIKEYDILEIYPDIHGEVVRVVRSGRKISGKVGEIETNNQRTLITIESVETVKHQLHPSFQRTFLLSDSGTFFLNSSDVIIWYEFSKLFIEDVREVAYVCKMLPPQGLDKATKLKVFTQAGVLKELACADKVEVDMVSYPSEKIAGLFMESGTFTPFLAILEYDREGKVRIIDTEKQSSLESEDSLTRLGSGVFDMHFRKQALGQRFAVTSNTIVFRIPPNIDDEDLFSREDYTFIRDGLKYEFIPYGNAKYNLLDVVIIPAKAGEILYNSSIMVVDRVSSSLNDKDQNIQPVLYGVVNGAMGRYFAAETVAGLVSTLKKGDVIRVAFDSRNEVSGITKIIYEDSETPLPNECVSLQKPEYGIVGNNFHVVYADVFSKKNGWIMVKYNVSGVDKEIIVDTNRIAPVVYDKSKDEVYVGTENDVFDSLHHARPSKALIRSSSASVNYLAIFNQ